MPPHAWSDRRKQELPTRVTLLKAFNAEAEMLQQVHVRLTKQLKRLELEEQLLLKMLVTTRDRLPANSRLLAEEPEELRQAIEGVEPFDTAAPSGQHGTRPDGSQSDSEASEDEGGPSAAEVRRRTAAQPPHGNRSPQPKRKRAAAAARVASQEAEEHEMATSADEEWEDVPGPEAPAGGAAVPTLPPAAPQQSAPGLGLPPRAPRREAGAEGLQSGATLLAAGGDSGQAPSQEQGGAESEMELSSGDEGRDGLEVDAPWE